MTFFASKNLSCFPSLCAEQLVLRKAEYEQTTRELEDRLNEEEMNNEELELQKRRLGEEVENLKHDIEDLELSIEKTEQEKTSKVRMSRSTDLSAVF